MPDEPVEQPTTTMRICRNPGCGIAFDPKWRVKLQDEPSEMDQLCPACGADLAQNYHVRKGIDGIFPFEKK